MSSRNLFRVILKVMGLFLIEGLLTSFGNLSFFFTDVFTGGGDDHSGVFAGVFAVVAIIAAYFLLMWLLLFKNDAIIDKLKLDRGMDTQLWPAPVPDTGEVRLKPIILLALLLVGIYIIIDEIPNLLSLAYNMYEFRHFEDMSKKIGASVVLCITKIVVASLLISNCNVITAFIERRIKKDENASSVHNRD